MLSLRVGTVGLGFISAAALARALGPSERGVLALAMLGISLATMALQFGMADASVQLVGARLHSVQETTVSLVSYFAVLGVVCAVPFYLILRHLGGVAPNRAVLCLAAVQVALFVGVPRAAMLAERAFLRYSLSSLAESVVYAGGLIALYTERTLTVDRALLLYAASLLVALVLTAMWEWGRRATYRDVRPRFAVIRSAGAAGVHLFVVGLGGFAVQRLNYFLLEAISGVRAVGLFAVAGTIPAVLSNGIQQVATVTYAHVATRETEGAGVELGLAVIRIVALGSLAVVVVSWLFARPLVVLLFGEEYREVAGTMAVLTVGAAFSGIGSIIFNALAGAGYRRVGSLVTLLGVACVALLGGLLIGPWSHLGAAIANAAAAVVSCVAYGWTYVRVYRLRAASVFVATTSAQTDAKHG